jgi:hypothetical protein
MTYRETLQAVDTLKALKLVGIVRYDCSHGFFHRDILNPKGEKVKQVIQIQNLKDALTYAEQDLKDRWEWYKERFKKGMK